MGLCASATLACATCGAPDATNVATGPATTAEPTPAAAPRLTVDIFAFARVLGTIAPCGCTTEPLGGLQYAFGYIEANSRPQTRLVLEPGSFLFADPAGPEAAKDEPAWAQAEQRAAALQTRFAGLGAQLVSGLGPTDLSSPKADLSLETYPLPRVLANSRKLDARGVQRHRLVRLGDDALAIDAGVTAVVEPGLAPSLAATAPAEALRGEIKAMREAGAELTVVLLQGSRATAEQLAREVEGIDLIVVGIPVGLERTRLGGPPARLGNTWVVEPGEQAQTLTHLRLEIDPAVAAKLPAVDSWTIVPTVETQRRELARLDARLEKFRADVSADKAFVARLEQERAALAASIEKPAPVSGAVVVTVAQTKVSCHLAVDPDAAKALHSYDNWVAAKNQQRFAGVRAPAPTKGQAGYVGSEQCEACHADEAAHWAKTRHGDAYATLVKANKQFDLSCVGCHVTGFREPGGSEVVENAGLQNVQCEQCHGPGSAHVAMPEKRGKANAIRRDASVEVCQSCHTPEHSDTFEYAAYLRDVLSPEHGPERRAALGEGPTGRELRAAGLAAAGGGCKKM
ncbi:MAG TPA: multiheme c-type cytochrome [Nannocystis sp.]|jgi:hypothetical protein